MTVADLNRDGHDDLAVAASGSRVAGLDRAGEVYVYFGGGFFDTVADLRLQSSRPERLAEFGRFMTSGDVNSDGYSDLLVPSFRADRGGLTNAGEVYVFFGGRKLDAVADLTLAMPTAEASAQFGASIAIGDVNSDGRADAVIGAHLADGAGLHDAGAAYVFYGGETFGSEVDVLLSASPETYPESGAEFGRDIAITDMDGDQRKDAVIASGWARSHDVVWAGKAEIFRGGPGMANSPSEVLKEMTPGRAHIFGWSLAGGQDMNGDGFDDLAVGAPRADQISGTSYRGDLVGSEGRIFVQPGGPSRLPAILLTEPEPQLGAHLGRDDMVLSDLNGDGFADLAAAAPFADLGSLVNAGRLQVFLGGQVLDGAADMTLTAPEPRAHDAFGGSTALGKLQRGGSQLVVGAAGRSNGRGAVFVYGFGRGANQTRV